MYLKLLFRKRHKWFHVLFSIGKHYSTGLVWKYTESQWCRQKLNASLCITSLDHAISSVQKPKRMFNKQVVSGCCKTWVNWHTNFPLGLTCRSKHCKEQNKTLVIQPVIIISFCISGSLILKLLKAFLATLLSTMWLPETLKQKKPCQVRPKVHLTWS